MLTLLNTLWPSLTVAFVFRHLTIRNYEQFDGVIGTDSTRNHISPPSRYSRKSGPGKESRAVKSNWP